MTTSCLFPIFVRQGRSRALFKVGYINHKGDVVISPTFDEGTRFYEGLASVRVANHWGIIDTSGQFVIQPASWGWCRFREGFASISVKGRWGVIDRKGIFLVEPRYDYLEPFRDDLAVFRVREGQKSRYGYLDKKGAEVIPAVFQDACGFSEGMAAVKTGNLWGYIAKSGVFKITPRFEGTRRGPRRVEDTRAGYFVNGLAPAWSGQGYGFIDAAGSLVIEARFDEADSFSEDRALVQCEKRYGFIDPSGTVSIDARFTYATAFSEGLAAVREKNYAVGFVPPCGFIDAQGNMVLRPTYYSAESFRNGLSLVKTKDSIGYINGKGEFVWHGSYVEYGTLC